MSTNESELCALLVGEIYGGLPYKIINTLLQRGRLSLAEIRRFSKLASHDVKSGLAVLIQQNLVLHRSLRTPDGSQAYYEAHGRNAYNLVRLGKIVKLADVRAGKSAGPIVAALQSLGHAKVKDVIAAIETGKQSLKTSHNSQDLQNGSVLNGIVKADLNPEISASSASSIPSFPKLIDVGLLESLRDPKQLMSIPDLRIEADRAFALKGQKPTTYGGKAKLEYEGRITNRIKNWRDTYGQCKGRGDLYRSDSEEDQQDTNPRKRRKTNGGTSHKVNGIRPSHIIHESDEEEEDFDIDDSVAFRLSHEKCNVMFRTEQFVKLSARCLGEPTSKVYEALLKCVEHRTDRCFDEYDDQDGNVQVLSSPSIQTSIVVQQLGEAVDLHSTIAPDGYLVKDEPENEIEASSSGLLKESEKRGKQVSLEQRRSHIEQHLQLLAEHPYAFVTRNPSVNPSIPTAWHVDFAALTRSLIQEALESIISARFGPYAKRVVRILYTQGKLDEKRLVHVALMRPKELRANLTAMQETGFLEVQEIPKDNVRAPKNTIYLWFFDQDRCRRLVLEETFKAMARLLQRARVEREKVRGVLGKAERTDVKGHEDVYLNEPEQRALGEWQRREEMLLVQLGRLDDLVALFRDFLPLVLT